MIMMEPYAISKDEKEEIRRRIVALLKTRREILFAYLHGSFLKDDFQDIDVAIYVAELGTKRDALKYELG